jgi:FlaA1/EpsC-like NDP-sugar epimerase
MPIFEKFVAYLKELNSFQKILFVLAADYLVLNWAAVTSYMLRLSSFELPPAETAFVYFIVPVLGVVSAYSFGVYEAAARNYSEVIERKLLASQITATLVWALLLVFIGTSGFARSTVIIYTVIGLLAMIVLRRFASVLFNVTIKPKLVRAQVPVVIYGAGREGMVLADSMRRSGNYRPVAFVDPDYTIHGRMVSGLRVFSVENLNHVIDKYGPREAIVANPNINRANRRVLVDMLLSQGLGVKIAPGLDQIIDGDVKVGDIRPIRVEDLLGRDPVPADRTLMENAVRDQVVMVTGAGGSIGSELVRQVCLYGPQKIVLVENNEFALFEIHRELESKLQKSGNMHVYAMLADVREKARIAAIIREHSVDIIFHAAAYKHVRMVQDNPVAGIDNNVFGTQAVAEAAMENGVKRFILISTDKAVRPTSAMGASKRVAEMTVQALAAIEGQSTIFSMVRFGNVLGSTGSVVPLFREQIAAGGPVMVTDREVTRYFMLIPEAAQLVIQAGAMAQGGDVFVLDMGESIKIMQLAETMIELAGLSLKTPDYPEGDIEIAISGLKPGEKLYEELQIGNEVSSTSHTRIMRSKEIFFPLEINRQHLRAIKDSAENEDTEQVVVHLMKIANLGQIEHK